MSGIGIFSVAFIIFGKISTLCGHVIFGRRLLAGGIYNYVQNPSLRKNPIKLQVISWLIPVIPSVLLVSCYFYARRLSPGGLTGVGTDREG
jgi:uncharacterized membrane protein HdeD (DUF308 family)